MTRIQRAGYSAPTPIQTSAIPPAVAGQDLIGTAQTGTGKTAAFVLPILQRLLPGPRKVTRLLAPIQQRHARVDKVEILVLDEADRMLDMGFLPDVKRILSHLPPRRQTMLFSATFPPEIEQLAAQTLTPPQRS